MVEQVPFARWALDRKRFRRGVKSLVDVGHIGKCGEVLNLFSKLLQKIFFSIYYGRSW